MSDSGDEPVRDLLVPSFDHVLTIDVDVDTPIEIGETGNGWRRIIPISGGSVTGRFEGTVLPAGADYQLFRIDRPTELVAQYALETEDGDRVYVDNRGIRVATSEIKERLRDGEEVDPEDVYMCTQMQFETASPDLEWLRERIFVSTGIRRPGGVRLAVWAVE